MFCGSKYGGGKQKGKQSCVMVHAPLARMKMYIYNSFIEESKRLTEGIKGSFTEGQCLTRGLKDPSELARQLRRDKRSLLCKIVHAFPGKGAGPLV